MKQWPTILIALMISLAMASPALAGEPTKIVKKRTAQVTKILSQKESKKRAKKLNSVLQQTIDFRKLAERSLKGYWEKRTEAEQKEFLGLLQQLLQANYEKKLQGKVLGKDYKVVYGAEKTSKDGSKAIVRTKIVYKKDSKPVAYKLMKNEGKKWIAYDIVIDDISLEETYRESYTEIIKEEGWPALIKRMKDKVKLLKK